MTPQERLDEIARIFEEKRFGDDPTLGLGMYKALTQIYRLATGVEKVLPRRVNRRFLAQDDARHPR